LFLAYQWHIYRNVYRGGSACLNTETGLISGALPISHR
jgi:hypothetical protein